MTKLGLIGTGLMGLPIAQRLLSTGFMLTAYNRTADKAEPLRTAGATIAPTVPELLINCEAIILTLSDATAIQSLLLTPQNQPYLKDRMVIQIGTIAPAESQTIAQAVVAAGGQYLEAPVLGSLPEAKSGTLLVMVGGDQEQFQQWLPLFQQLGANPRWIGPVGTAAALKLALNQLIGSLTTGFALSLGLVLQHGVEVECFMDILRQSALYAPTFDKKLARMLDRNFENPNFPTKHLLKDMNLFITAARAVGLKTDSADGIQAVLLEAIQKSLAELDYSALFSAVNPATISKTDDHQSGSTT